MPKKSKILPKLPGIQVTNVVEWIQAIESNPNADGILRKIYSLTRSRRAGYSSAFNRLAQSISSKNNREMFSAIYRDLYIEARCLEYWTDEFSESVWNDSISTWGIRLSTHHILSAVQTGLNIYRTMS